MKAIRVHNPGGPEALRYEEAPDPEPETGEVLIRVEAAGINFADTLARKGLYPTSTPPPFIPGFEVAGAGIAGGGGDKLGRHAGAERVVSHFDSTTLHPGLRSGGDRHRGRSGRRRDHQRST